jgi:hypothetical protein
MPLMGTRLLCRAIIGVLITSPAWAAEPTTALDSSIAPFVIANTLVVARLDPSQLDFTAIQARHEEMLRRALRPGDLDNILAGYHQAISGARRWLHDFHKAGGRVIYAIVLMGDPSDPPVIVVPLEPGTDARAIEGLLVSGEPGGPDRQPASRGANPQSAIEAIVLNNAVAFGSVRKLDKIKTSKPVDGRLFATALSSVGDAPVKAAFVPSFALKLVAGQILPGQIPTIAGGILTIKLANGLTWAAVALNPPPGPSVRLVIQCKDQSTTQAYADLTDALLELFRTLPENPATMDDLDQTIEALRPRITGDLLSFSLDSQTAEDVIVPLIRYATTPSPRPMLVQSASNARKLVLGVLEHKAHFGKYPDKIEQVALDIGGSAALIDLLTSPNPPYARPGYRYLPPGPNADPQTIVLYEVEGPPLLAVAFLDGHVESMTQQQLELRLKRQHPAKP